MGDFTPYIQSAFSAIKAEAKAGFPRVRKSEQLMKRAYTATFGDGGAVPRVGLPGKVALNAYGKPKKRRLTTHQQARAAYTMVKDLMPRMKSLQIVMFNNWENAESGTIGNFLSGVNGNNTATILHDRSGINLAETVYRLRTDVVASGYSMTLRTTDTIKLLQQSCCFPFSHVNLITKGDAFDQRLGDFVEFTGVHVTGRIDVFSFKPLAGSGTLGPYPPAHGLLPENGPRNLLLDPKRKVRLMLVLVEDSGEEVEAAEDDRIYYGDDTWQERVDGVSTDRLSMVNIPRLQNILEVEDQPSVPGKAMDRQVSVNGRWQKIDRKYRSNHSNENTWQDPGEGRKVDFTVVHDVTFTLAPRPRECQSASSVEPVNQGFAEKAHIDVDFFVKMDLDMSYLYHDAGDLPSGSPAVAATRENGSQKLVWYLFDDHMDILDVDGVSNPAQTTLTSNNILDEVTVTGYSMCKAFLRAQIFFNDDL